MDRVPEDYDLDDRDDNLNHRKNRHYHHHHHNFDVNEFYNQQKEIEVALSSAFDDVSNLSDFTPSEDEDEYTDARSHTRTVDKRIDATTNSDERSDHLGTSTPIQPSKSYFRQKLSDYNSNVDDLLPKTTCYLRDLDNRASSHYSENGSHFFNEDNELEVDSKFGSRATFNKEQVSSSLLLENDKLSKQLCMLRGNCAKINCNYETLQDKFSRLFNENKTNLEIIEQLKTKVKKLESELIEEKQSKEIIYKKTIFLESQVESLEESLNEHRKYGFVARTNDTQEKIINNLKHKHDKELDILRTEIEKLNQQLHEKEEEMIARNKIVEKYSQEALQRLLESSKKVMYEQMEKDIKLAKEKSGTELLQSFDNRIVNLKEDWQSKLQEDIDKIIHCINHGMQTQNFGNFFDSLKNVHFASLKSLCHILQVLLNEREQRIQLQIAKFLETKKQLEEALLESKLSSSSISNNSDKSQLFEELRLELDKYREESGLLSHKLNKYKKHYRFLEKRHEQEIEMLKQQFDAVIEGMPNQYCSNN